MGAEDATKQDFEDEESDENPEEDSDEEEDDGINHDERILGNTTDAILYLARAYGNSFAPYFREMYPDLKAYTTEAHPKSDRNMIIGCVAEVFAACESVVPEYYQEFLAFLTANANTTDSKINRNIAYAIGVLAEVAPLLFK